MLRRSPTRIELKIDDVNEWIALRLDKDKRSGGEGTTVTFASLTTQLRTNREMIHERIGYDPSSTSGGATAAQVAARENTTN